MTRNEIKVDYVVLGAGIGGLAAGFWMRNLGIEEFLVFDNSDEFTSNLHNGVHYLHSVPNLLDLDVRIKPVTLSDGVLKKFGTTSTAEITDKPTLLDSLQYSKKVREIQHPSSIMEIGKRENVWLPESNNMNDLSEAMYRRIEDKCVFSCTITKIDRDKKVIEGQRKGEDIVIKYKYAVSTLPLNIVTDRFDLRSVPIYITNCKVGGIVPNWLINLYVPDPSTPIYRMSILNNIASFESIGPLSDEEIEQIADMFAMFNIDTSSAKGFVWRTGKVLSISTDERYQLVKDLAEQDWYQIGRFGLWNRKLLMDSTMTQAEEVVKHLHKYIKKDKSQLLDLLSK